MAVREVAQIANVRVFTAGDYVLIHWTDKHGKVRTIPFERKYAKDLAHELLKNSEGA